MPAPFPRALRAGENLTFKGDCDKGTSRPASRGEREQDFQRDKSGVGPSREDRLASAGRRVNWQECARDTVFCPSCVFFSTDDVQRRVCVYVIRRAAETPRGMGPPVFSSFYAPSLTSPEYAGLRMRSPRAVKIFRFPVATLLGPVGAPRVWTFPPESEKNSLVVQCPSHPCGFSGGPLARRKIRWPLNAFRTHARTWITLRESRSAPDIGRVDISRRTERAQYQSKDFGAQRIDKGPSIARRYVISRCPSRAGTRAKLSVGREFRGWIPEESGSSRERSALAPTRPGKKVLISSACAREVTDRKR